MPIIGSHSRGQKFDNDAAKPRGLGGREPLSTHGLAQSERNVLADPEGRPRDPVPNRVRQLLGSRVNRGRQPVDEGVDFVGGLLAGWMPVINDQGSRRCHRRCQRRRDRQSGRVWLVRVSSLGRRRKRREGRQLGLAAGGGVSHLNVCNADGATRETFLRFVSRLLPHDQLVGRRNMASNRGADSGITRPIAPVLLVGRRRHGKRGVREALAATPHGYNGVAVSVGTRRAMVVAPNER